MGSVGWVRDRSERSLRAALARVIPALAESTVRINARPSNPDPQWWSASAIVDERFVVKYAWSEQPAVRLWREGIVLQRLRMRDRTLALPDVVAVHADPALVITRLITPSAPLSWEWASSLRDAERERVAGQLASFLARLHADDLVDVVDDLPLIDPAPQADTTRLRREYPDVVDAQRAVTVLGWCAWVDDILREPAPRGVLVHGDLHGYNQVWDPTGPALRAVADFETCGLSDPHFDFRYLPGNSATLDLALDTIHAYEQLTPHPISINRVMAWHTLTTLGDALWRTQAGVELPGGGTAATWVDDLAHRLRALHLL